MPVYVTALRLWALLALSLHILSYFLPAETAWSVWPYRVLPFWLGLLLAGAIATLVVPRWNQRVLTLIRTGWTWLLDILPGRDRPQRWFIILSIATLPLFWLGRIRHLQWGDAEVLVAGLSHPEQTVIYNWQAPLTVFLHQRLWAWVIQPLTGWGVDTAYALVSVLCGGLFVYILLNTAYSLSQNSIERALIIGLVLTSGTIQLFFGYIENYTVITLGLMIFLWLGLKACRGEVSLWPVSLTLALTNAFHPSTVVLWPAVIYLAWLRYQQEVLTPSTVLGLIVPPLVLANSVLTLMELGNHGLAAFLGDDRPGGGDHRWFVPLFELQTQWERYTLFSPAHFLDWANEHFLLSVFGLWILLLAIIWLWQQRNFLAQIPLHRQRELWFLGLASLFYILLTWIWNADYGIRRDWDLFSPSALPYSLFAALILPFMLKDKVLLAQATLLIIAISALHTVTWILVNTTSLNL